MNFSKSTARTSNKKRRLLNSSPAQQGNKPLPRGSKRKSKLSPAGQRAGRANSESERASPTQQTFVANRFSTTRNRRYKVNESNRQKIRKTGEKIDENNSENYLRHTRTTSS